jgi:hypothetical protein
VCKNNKLPTSFAASGPVLKFSACTVLNGMGDEGSEIKDAAVSVTGVVGAKGIEDGENASVRYVDSCGVAKLTRCCVRQNNHKQTNKQTNK